MSRANDHKWQQVGENLYECTKCSCEIEGYAECIFACTQSKDSGNVDGENAN
jgi:hypothetical protein